MSPLRHRLVTAGAVVLLLVASHVLLPDARERVFAQYVFVLTLGYGHLLGAALGAQRRGGGSRIAIAFGGVTLLTLFALYAEAVTSWPWLALPLLALSVWHTTENDLALARALRTRSALGRLPRNLRAQGAALGVAAAIVALAVAASGDEGLLGDVFATSTLYHVIGWLVFLIARGTCLSRLLVLHLVPAGLCLALLVGPQRALAPLRELAFSPALYLFWASLHVAHTALVRERSVA